MTFERNIGMTFADLIDQDITVYAENGEKYRGILREIDSGEVLKFEVGIDVLYLNVRVLYGATVHGISPEV